MSDEVPDVVGTVRGYRNWDLKHGDLLPLHFHRDCPWKQGENLAQCTLNYRLHNDAQIPGEECCCGFHSMYAPQRPSIPSMWQLDGVVESWGNICLHRYGLRAQYSRIVAIYAPQRKERGVLTEHYPEVRLYKSRKHMLRDFPPAEEICGIPVVETPLATVPLTIRSLPWWLNLLPLLILLAAFGIMLEADVAQPEWSVHFILGFWLLLMWMCVRTTRRRL